MPTTPPSRLRSRPSHTAGLGDGFTKAFEVALTPAVFGGIGWVLDRVAGTSPVFVIGLALFGLVGTFLRLWYRYDATMKIEESRTIEARREADRLHAAAATSETFEIADPFAELPRDATAQVVS